MKLEMEIPDLFQIYLEFWESGKKRIYEGTHYYIYIFTSSRARSATMDGNPVDFFPGGFVGDPSDFFSTGFFSIVHRTHKKTQWIKRKDSRKCTKGAGKNKK